MILYLDCAGCAWRYLPAGVPLWQTAYAYFATWRNDGTLACLDSQLRTKVMAAAGRRRSRPPRSLTPGPCGRSWPWINEAAERVGEPVLRPE